MDLFEGFDEQNPDERLQWLHAPEKWRFDDDGLTIVPKKETDFYRPYGQAGKDNAALLYTEVSGDFTAIAHAFADLAHFGDAAALTVRADESRWAKLCLERSPIGDVSAVSMVTNPWSDDANNELLSVSECHLRITRKGNTFGMHYSTDRGTWRFVRAFALELPESVMVGIHAQAPYGAGCRARFASFEISDRPVDDFRSGE